MSGRSFPGPGSWVAAEELKTATVKTPHMTYYHIHNRTHTQRYLYTYIHTYIYICSQNICINIYAGYGPEFVFLQRKSKTLSPQSQELRAPSHSPCRTSWLFRVGNLGAWCLRWGGEGWGVGHHSLCPTGPIGCVQALPGFGGLGLWGLGFRV